MLPAVVSAESAPSVLGASGELYRVKSGTYGALFAHPPAGLEDNPVLALDVVRDGSFQRLLVPGTEGVEAEQAPAITLDHTTNSVFLVWEGQHNIHSVLDIVGYSADGFGDAFEFSGDPFSTKANPQLATTLDNYQTLGDDGDPVPASRTILHLVWYDDGSLGQRVLYTPLVIEAGDVLRTNRVFDLQELDGGDPASGPASAAAPASLLKKPQIRSGRDGQSVVIAFVAPGNGRLSSLELRSVTGELVSFADKARAQVIEIGRNNPSLSRRAIADKARAQVIEIGRRLMRKEAADYLAASLLETVGASLPDDDLEDVADAARAQVIEIGVSLRRGIADKARAQVIEIGRATAGPTHLLDLRKAARRDLPTLPDRPLRVFLSQQGDNAALAWSVDGAVRYRETDGDGSWGPERVLTLSPTFTSDEAFALVQQRLAAR
jgi:hypothetical protein